MQYIILKRHSASKPNNHRSQERNSSSLTCPFLSSRLVLNDVATGFLITLTEPMLHASIAMVACRNASQLRCFWKVTLRFLYTLRRCSQSKQCLLLSIRLSAQAIHHLLGKTQCDLTLVSPRTRHYFQNTFDTTDTSKAATHTTDAVSFENFLSGHRDEDLTYSHLHSCKSAVRENDRNVIIHHLRSAEGDFPYSSLPPWLRSMSRISRQL